MRLQTNSIPIKKSVKRINNITANQSKEVTVDINIEHLHNNIFKEAQQRDEIIQDIKMKIENENGIVRHKEMKNGVKICIIFMPNKYKSNILSDIHAVLHGG